MTPNVLDSRERKRDEKLGLRVTRKESRTNEDGGAKTQNEANSDNLYGHLRPFEYH